MEKENVKTPIDFISQIIRDFELNRCCLDNIRLLRIPQAREDSIINILSNFLNGVDIKINTPDYIFPEGYSMM